MGRGGVLGMRTRIASSDMPMSRSGRQRCCSSSRWQPQRAGRVTSTPADVCTVNGVPRLHVCPRQDTTGSRGGTTEARQCSEHLSSSVALTCSAKAVSYADRRPTDGFTLPSSCGIRCRTSPKGGVDVENRRCATTGPSGWTSSGE